MFALSDRLFVLDVEQRCLWLPHRCHFIFTSRSASLWVSLWHVRHINKNSNTSLYAKTDKSLSRQMEFHRFGWCSSSCRVLCNPRLNLSLQHLIGRQGGGQIARAFFGWKFITQRPNADYILCIPRCLKWPRFSFHSRRVGNWVWIHSKCTAENVHSIYKGPTSFLIAYSRDLNLICNHTSVRSAIRCFFFVFWIRDFGLAFFKKFF